jgi:hypothetical protein
LDFQSPHQICQKKFRRSKVFKKFKFIKLHLVGCFDVRSQMFLTIY